MTDRSAGARQVRAAVGHDVVVDVEWPDRREDVLAALDVLAAEPPALDNGIDPRWPDLSNAVHWLVDDTSWDETSPSESIGTILRDEREAVAVTLVVRAVVAVSERQGPNGVDEAWFADESWSEVRSSASNAADALRGRNR